MLETDIIWQQCLILLKEQFGEQNYNTWFKQLQARYEDNKLQIIANNRLVQDFIRNKYLGQISNILNELTGGIDIELIVAKQSEIKPSTPKTYTTKSASAKQNKPQDKDLADNLQQATKLNPNYTFDTLVRGNSNQLAYAIGMHVTQKLGHKNHNPLFIYGGVGLGKTHLMQAIGNEQYKNNPKAKIRYSRCGKGIYASRF